MASERHNRYYHPELADIYDNVKISPEDPRDLTPSRLHRQLHALHRECRDRLRLEKVGESVEGRDIFLVTMGHGPRSVFMWSQMHGNEPTATNALLDLMHFLCRKADHPIAQSLLSKLTLYMVPMLNPDGAERFERRNAQGLDINRDARDLVTPEGRLLKALQQQLKPDFGFNLHDQNARRTVGDTNRIVAIALLVPPIDARETRTEQIIAAEKIASVMCQALTPYLDGHLAKYDASFMPNAFGDNFQRWGTTTVLLESGGWFENDPAFLVKMNFIAIVEACLAIARDTYHDADPALYRSLPQNDKELFDLLIEEAILLDDVHPEPIRSEIGVNFIEEHHNERHCPAGRIVDIGDLRVYSARRTISARDQLLLPGLIGLVSRSDAKRLPDEQVFLKYLKRGYTTLLVPVPTTEQRAEKFQSLLERFQRSRLPVNVAFVLEVDETETPAAGNLDFGDALAQGALALLRNTPAADAPADTRRIMRWFNRPEIRPQEFNAVSSWPELLARKDLAAAKKRAEALYLTGRGSLRVDDYADLVLYPLQSVSPLRLKQKTPSRVFVNGRQVLARGKLLPEKVCGRLILASPPAPDPSRQGYR